MKNLHTSCGSIDIWREKKAAFQIGHAGGKKEMLHDLKDHICWSQVCHGLKVKKGGLCLLFRDNGSEVQMCMFPGDPFPRGEV